MTPSQAFQAARDVLLKHRIDYESAIRDYRAPQLERFNWALDWFDVMARGNSQLALWIIDDAGEKRFTFEEMRVRSNRAANFLLAQGVERGDRILLMLPNIPALWEVMLGAMKVGAVIIPATTQLTPADLRDRLERGHVRHVITEPPGAAKVDELAAQHGRLVVGGDAKGWRRWEEMEQASGDFQPKGDTRASDPMLLYFTSGTTAKPKLVLHTQQSYPVGHLSTMYWIGLKPGDVHWNISSPGWAKHAWSNVFAPWNAGATVFVYNYVRFSAPDVLGVLDRCRVTTLCAPPTVWRMLILADLARSKVHLREAVSAGEPLNPEVIERVREGWGLTIRDGFGQTETTCQVGNSPGQPLKAGSMGRPMPGYEVRLLDADGNPAQEGELCLSLSPRPLGLMVGYQDDPEMTARVTAHGHYHTGDVAARDADGYLTYVGRADDVFKASDYRISPFELESVLIEHPAVAEAALVPSPDPVRLAVPKAFVVLKPGFSPGKELARDILKFAREKLAPYKRVRRLEFAELPKTISGKIRRVELRVREMNRTPEAERGPNEYWVDDFPDLRG